MEVDQLQRQAQERQERKAAEAKAKEQTEAQQLLWAQEADRLQADVDVSRRRNAEKVAAFVKDQAEKKKGRDEVLREVYRNRVDDRYFNQFGTSHR